MSDESNESLRRGGEGERRFLAELRLAEKIETNLEGQRAPSAERPHPVVPDHELLQRIGRGSYGEVWLAKNVVGTFRAVKIVYRDSFSDSRPYEREYRGIQKFEPVSRSNDGFMDILQIGRNDELGCFYYIMELADNGSVGSDDPEYYIPKTLQEITRQRGRLTFEECLQYAMPLNLALGHLHRQGLIHRDIKPSNIIFIGGIPKLADIGLVTDVGEARSFVGTEGFIPPEGPNSPQADIYSLGKVLYEMSMGKDRTEFPEPFTELGQGAGSQELEELNAVILKACASDPANRYQTAEEMHVDLALLQNGKSVKAKRMLERRLGLARRAGAVVATIAMIAIGAYVYQQSQTREARSLAQKEAFQRSRAESLLNLLQLKQAENYFENDEGGKGVSYLSRLLRQNPSNQVAASRMLSALTDRSFALPVWGMQSPERIAGNEFSPDGSLIVVWTRTDNTNGVARILNTATGQPIGQPMRHNGGIQATLFSPDGRWIATVTTDGTAHIWNSATGEAAGPPLVHHAKSVADVKFSPDSERLLTICEKKAYVWNRQTGQQLFPPFDAASNPLKDASFSPDGTRILTATTEVELALWDSQTGRRLIELDLSTINAPGSGIPRFSPKGDVIAAASWSSILLWDATSGRLLHRLEHGARISDMNFSPDGLRLAAGDVDRRVKIWDVPAGHALLSGFEHKTDVWGVIFDPTGERLLTSEMGRARVWDSRTGKPIIEWLENTWRARFSPNGTHVLGSNPQQVVLWDVRPGRALNLAFEHRCLVSAARFSANGSNLFTLSGGQAFNRGAGGIADEEAVVWDAKSGELAAPRYNFPEGLQYGELSSDQQSILIASYNGQARLWNPRAQALVIEPLRHDAMVWMARQSPDGSMIATGSADKTARVWDAKTGLPLTDPLSHSGEVFAVEFSPDNRHLLTIVRDETVQIWNVKSQKILELPKAGNPLTATYSPDGKSVVVAYVENKAILFDAGTALPYGEPLLHRGLVNGAWFSPDGRRVVTVSSDQTARFWDATTGLPIGAPLEHGSRVTFASFSRDSRRIVTASINGNFAQVWDVETSRPLTEPLRHRDGVTYAEFSPNGAHVATGSVDGTAKIWELPTANLPVPRWLLDLAVGAAGHRLSDQENPEPVVATKFLAAKEKVMASRATDPYTEWAQWFLSDRVTRKTSTESSVTATKYLDRLLSSDSKHLMREALSFLPENGLATAKLAIDVLRWNNRDFQHKTNIAEFLSKRAITLSPQESRVWRIRAEILQETGRSDEAGAALTRALQLAPESPENLILEGEWAEKKGLPQKALVSYTRAIVATEPTEAGPDEARKQIRKTALLKRAIALSNLGRFDDAAADRLQALEIPARVPATPSALLNLSTYYNRSLAGGQGQNPIMHPGDNLASLPVGNHFLDGVRFDLRGSILVGKGPFDAYRESFAQHIRGIHVDQRCERLHFLQAVMIHSSADGIPGQYVIHYENGSRLTVPVIPGKNIGSWDEADPEKGSSSVAWREANNDALAGGHTRKLYTFSWTNPTPNISIKTIDYETVEGAILVVAITAQTEPSPTIQIQPQPKTVSSGEDAAFSVVATSRSRLLLQWQFDGVDLPGETNASLNLKRVTRLKAGLYSVQIRNASEEAPVIITSDAAPLIVREGRLAYGMLRREVFQNIPGTTLTELTNHARFPDQPDNQDLVYNFEASSNVGDNYGVRLRGVLVPSKTGPHRFFLSSDDQSALFLSSDESPTHKSRIAFEPVFGGERFWRAYYQRPKQENVSAPIHLEAGRRYYIEALMKEGKGNDNLAVAWQMPGDTAPANFSSPIPGAYLAAPEKDFALK